MSRDGKIGEGPSKTGGARFGRCNSRKIGKACRSGQGGVVRGVIVHSFGRGRRHDLDYMRKRA